MCVWVLTSVDDVTAAEATAHLQDAAQHHDWTLHDLSIIWKNTLSGGRVKPLLLGFTLFQKVGDIHMLCNTMCSDYYVLCITMYSEYYVLCSTMYSA